MRWSWRIVRRVLRDEVALIVQVPRIGMVPWRVLRDELEMLRRMFRIRRMSLCLRALRRFDPRYRSRW